MSEIELFLLCTSDNQESSTDGSDRKCGVKCGSEIRSLALSVDHGAFGGDRRSSEANLVRFGEEFSAEELVENTSQNYIFLGFYLVKSETRIATCGLFLDVGLRSQLENGRRTLVHRFELEGDILEF